MRYIRLVAAALAIWAGIALAGYVLASFFHQVAQEAPEAIGEFGRRVVDAYEKGHE